MKKKLLTAAVTVLVALSATAPAGAKQGGDPRSPFEARRGNIYLDAGLSTDPGPTAAADSADPKSSSLAFSAGDYLTFWNYWHDPAAKRTLSAATAQYKVSWKGQLTGGSPRINVFLADATGAMTGEYLFLDPSACVESTNSKGWSVSNFQASGARCTIYDSAGNAFTGTDAGLGVDGLVGTADDVAATRAMDLALAGKVGQYVYFSYLLNDHPDGTPEVLLDRITFGGSVLTKF